MDPAMAAAAAPPQAGQAGPAGDTDGPSGDKAGDPAERGADDAATVAASSGGEHAPVGLRYQPAWVPPGVMQPGMGHYQPT